MNTKECDACGVEQPINPFTELIESGWCMPFTSFGYYEGFSDDLDRDEQWHLCHDCIVKFLALFPRLAESLGKGLHPSSTDETPCCDHAWRPTDLFGKYELDQDGNYVPVAGEHFQQAHQGKWISGESK